MSNVWELRDSSGALRAIIGPTPIDDAIDTARLWLPNRLLDLTEVHPDNIPEFRRLPNITCGGVSK